MPSRRSSLVGVSLAALALAACGSSSGNATSASGGSPSGASSTAATTGAGGAAGGASSAGGSDGSGGSGGVACPTDPGGTCPPETMPGTVTPLGFMGQDGVSLAVDASSAYWATDAEIMSIALTGGTATTLASNLNAPRSLTLIGDALYWLESGEIRQIPLAGGTPTTLSTLTLSTNAMAYEPVTKTFILAAVAEGGTADVLQTLPFQGGTTPTTIATITPEGALALTYAVDPTGVYFGTGSTLDHVDLQGKSRQTLTPLAMGGFGAAAFGVAIDETDAFFTDSDGIKKVSKCGGTPNLVSTQAVNTENLAVDSDFVYWTAAPGSINATELMKTSVHGICSSSVVAKNQQGPLMFAIGPTNVLWAAGLPNVMYSLATAPK
jgi:hypothetical protein